MKSGACVAWPALARIRRSRKVSLRQIAAVTKIKTHYVRAIEGGEFGKLPGGVYTRSYIRQYARVIGFDEEDLLARFSLQTEETAPTDASVTHRKDPPPKGLHLLLHHLLGGRDGGDPSAPSGSKWERIAAGLKYWGY